MKDVETSGSDDRLTVINYAFGNVAPDTTGNVVCKLGDDWADYQKPWTADEGEMWIAAFPWEGAHDDVG